MPVECNTFGIHYDQKKKYEHLKYQANYFYIVDLTKSNESFGYLSLSSNTAINKKDAVPLFIIIQIFGTCPRMKTFLPKGLSPVT